MGRYILTVKVKKRLESKGHILICKICECPLIAGLSRKAALTCGHPEMMGDEVESKQQRKGKCKFYHAKCYDQSHYETKDNGNGEGNWVKTDHDTWILNNLPRRWCR